MIVSEKLALEVEFKTGTGNRGLNATKKQVHFIKYWRNIIVRMGSPRGKIANVLDCNIVVSKYEPQSCYDVHFQNNIFRKAWTLQSLQLLVK